MENRAVHVEEYFKRSDQTITQLPVCVALRSNYENSSFAILVKRKSPAHYFRAFKTLNTYY